MVCATCRGTEFSRFLPLATDEGESQPVGGPCVSFCLVKVAARMEDFMTTSIQTVERCIEECLQCLRWCAQCRAESLDQDPIMMRDCIRLCNECLELCRTCVTLLTGGSGFAYRVCSICSELCTACAAECGKHDGETMRKCAQACNQCAATCAEVAQAGPIQRLTA